VQPTDEAGEVFDDLVTGCPCRQRLDGYVALDVLEYLAALIVVSERLGNEVRAVQPNVAEVRLDGGGEWTHRSSYGLPGTNHVRDAIAGQRLLVVHARMLPATHVVDLSL
jgi:hypothetical protein